MFKSISSNPPINLLKLLLSLLIHLDLWCDVGSVMWDIKLANTEVDDA